jgi:selenocysteine lyase/cysteine desulfurase
MLGTRLRGQLDALPGVSTHDLGEQRCAIVTARVEGVPAAGVAAELGRAGINVSTTIAEHSPLDTQDRAVHPLVRFSPHYYNNEQELDRAVELVAAIARGRRPTC